MKKEIDRRGFLGVAVAAPVAASQAFRTAAGYEALEGHGVPDCPTDYVSTDRINPWDVYKKLGLPDWKKAELAEEAKVSLIIDPGIDCLRSCSWGAKVRMQAKVNYGRAIRKSHHSREVDGVRRAFSKKYKLEWI